MEEQHGTIGKARICFTRDAVVAVDGLQLRRRSSTIGNRLGAGAGNDLGNESVRLVSDLMLEQQSGPHVKEHRPTAPSQLVDQRNESVLD